MVKQAGIITDFSQGKHTSLHQLPTEIYCLKFANIGMLMDAFIMSHSLRCLYFDELIFCYWANC